MKYTICLQDAEGRPLSRVVDPDTGEMNSFDDHESANVWLIEAARTEKIDIKLGGYSVQCIDDDGNILEAVDERDAEQAAEEANKLVAENEDIKQAVSTIIASRQMYAVGVTELERILDGLEEKPHPLVADVFMQTAANTATEPFDETILFQGLVETIFPWMQKICKQHTDEEIAELRVEQQEGEQRRRAIPIPTGVTLDTTEEPLLTRGRNVIFVGYRPAIRVLLDHITNHVLASHSEKHPNRVFTVLRLLEKASKEDAQPNLTRLGKQDWEWCAATSKAWPKLVHGKILNMLPAMPDLFICDDMPATYQGLTGSHEAMRANEALKIFARWSKKEAGCAFVGAIPMGSEAAPLFMGSQWARIKTHSVLRAVTVVREGDDLEEGQCKILVGRNAFSMVIDKELLKGGGDIIQMP